MMLKRISLVLALALIGCDGGSEPRNVTKIQVGDSGAYADRLRALSPVYRDLALRRAIQDSGQSCRRVERSAERGTYQNMSVWTVRCHGKRDWGVFIGSGGNVQVRRCEHMEQLGLPACNLDG